MAKCPEWMLGLIHAVLPSHQRSNRMVSAHTDIHKQPRYRVCVFVQAYCCASASFYFVLPAQIAACGALHTCFPGITISAQHAKTSSMCPFMHCRAPSQWQQLCLCALLVQQPRGLRLPAVTKPCLLGPAVVAAGQFRVAAAAETAFDLSSAEDPPLPTEWAMRPCQLVPVQADIAMVIASAQMHAAWDANERQ